MSKKEVMATEATAEFDSTKVCASIVRDDNGDVRLKDEITGELSEPLRISKDGIAYLLPRNSSNRKFANVVNVNKVLDTGASYEMVYKASIKLGSVSKHAPYEKWICFLDEAEQNEVKDLYAKAVAAKAAAKPEPKSEADKLRDKIAKLQAKIAKLDTTNDTVNE